VDKISSVFDILGDESGAIIIPPEAIKKIKDLIKRKKFTEEEVIVGLKLRGATTKDIEKVFPSISIHELNEGKSEWLKNGYTIVMKNLIYNVIVSLLSGIGIFFIVSGVGQHPSLTLTSPGPALWEFNPTIIGIGTAFIVGAVLLYKNTRSKSK
jgi:hypothetical protein